MILGAALSLWYFLIVAVAEQGDPIPEEISQVLGSSNIRSIADLQLALQIDSVEEDTVNPSERAFRKAQTVNSSLPRIIRSIAPRIEPAVLAECKIRTEVFEITRNMVDPTNANFLVWPPGVEVQRCSGCCNTKNVKCNPSKAQIRQVLVTKIEYVQTKPVFKKVVVSLEDHLECRCEVVVQPGSHSIPVSTTEAEAAPVATSSGMAARHQQATRRKQRKHKLYRGRMPFKESLAT